MSTLQNALELIENLDYIDQEQLFEILQKRRIESRRNEILLNAEQTYDSISKGTAKIGLLKDLMSDLES